MRRKDLIGTILKDLSRLGVTYPLFEILINGSNFPGVSVPRTIFIEGATSKDEIKALFERYTNGNVFPVENIKQYDRAEDLKQSNLVPQDSLSLGLNWRGRICKWNKLNNITSSNAFLEATVNSYWRLLITKKDNDFFTRFEIVPAYYNPGFSAIGLENFYGELTAFFRYLKKMKEVNELDSKFDRIVVYTRKEPATVFERCLPAFFHNHNSISYEELVKEINRRSENEIIQEVYDAINANFN